MTEPQPGRIYWSSRAQRFYQEGRRGAVSREQAIPTLRQTPGTTRIRDELGRFVPERVVLEATPQVTRFTGRDQQGRPFLASEFIDRPTSPGAIEGQRLAGNQQVVIRTVVTTPDGVTHVSYSSSRLGTRVDLAYLRQNAAKKASADLRDKGYDIDTPTVNTVTRGQSLVIRSVNVRPGR